MPWKILLVCTFIPCFCAQAGAPTHEGSGVFPTIAAEALDKSPVNLPSQLEGRLNLLLLSWARDQGPQMDTWTAASQALQHADSEFRVYRMLVSARESALYRWWDNSSLRSAETDPELLHWSVPLYTDKRALQEALELSGNEHKIAAVLVDRTGRVLWKAEGPSAADTRAGLQAAAKNAH